MKRLLALTLSLAVLVYAEGNTFDRVRYNGGSVPSTVDPKSWDNKLTVTSDAVVLDLKDHQHVSIPARSVTSLSYGQEAHRRVGTMIALAVLVAPVALFGLFHKTRLHYVGIQYTSTDGKSSGILLQADKDNYRPMLVALQGVTGAPVSVSEKERSFVPVGVTATVTKAPDESKPSPSSTASTGASSAEGTCAVNVSSVPDGAEIFVDDHFYGNSPATLKLKPGKHAVHVKMPGYAEWVREISADAGATTRLIATLEKAN